jgi:hypothetical protein
MEVKKPNKRNYYELITQLNKKTKTNNQKKTTQSLLISALLCTRLAHNGQII